MRLLVGLFDSGLGGLTVLRQVHGLYPHTRCLYLGDTARVPYGQRSVDDIRAIAAEVVHWLRSQGVGVLVMACNTSNALALDVAVAEAGVPVVGLIDNGAHPILRVQPSVAAERPEPELLIPFVERYVSKVDQAQRQMMVDWEKVDVLLAGADVFVMQSHCEPINDRIMQQLLMIDAAKRAVAHLRVARSGQRIHDCLLVASTALNIETECAGAFDAIDLHRHTQEGLHLDV